jgi:hypothetical protein
MKIKNKYLRNRVFRSKHWNRIRSETHPYANTHGAWWFNTPEQISHNFESITRHARALENGTRQQWVVWRASSGFRRLLNRGRRAQERVAMQKIRNGQYETEMPFFKQDATWLYF